MHSYANPLCLDKGLRIFPEVRVPTHKLEHLKQGHLRLPAALKPSRQKAGFKTALLLCLRAYSSSSKLIDN